MMDINVEKFVKDYGRMCDTYCSNECHGCPVADSNAFAECNHIKKLEYIAPIVQKWTEEHPIKTYLMDMKEKFPDMIIDNDFTMKYCVWRFYGNNAKPKEGCVMGYCEKCWNREIK